jgi:hypothetical protein
VVCIKARDSRLRDERVTDGDLERSAEALAFWEKRSYKHGGFDLMREYGEQLRLRKNAKGAVEVWLAGRVLGQHLKHPGLPWVENRLRQLGIEPDDQAVRKHSEHVIASTAFRGFFTTFTNRQVPEAVTKSASER